VRFSAQSVYHARELYHARVIFWRISSLYVVPCLGMNNLAGCTTINFSMVLAIEKIGDSEKLEILVQNQSFWNIVGARPTAAPRIGGRDNAAEIMIVWRTSPLLILHIDSLHQVATVTPSHVPLRRRGIIITIFHGIGTNCMVPSDWDSTPRYV